MYKSISINHKWICVLFCDLQQYRGNLFTIKANRGVFIAFLLVIFMPRDVQSFFRLLVNSSNALLNTSQLPSLLSIVVFNGILLFSYLIQSKILPIAYNSNYIPGIFDRLSVFISRELFFIITNWFVLAWILAGLLLSPSAFNNTVILKLLFIFVNTSFTLSVMHEKRYIFIPILFFQLVIYAYLSEFTIISIVNISMLILMFSRVYNNGALQFNLLYFLKKASRRFVRHYFVSGPQSLRFGILLRQNFLSSIGIGCALVFFYNIFYHSLLFSGGGRDRLIWLYTLFPLYLLSYVYAKLNLQRKKIGSFIAAISPRSTEVIHDFLFVLVIFEMVQIISIMSFPTAWDSIYDLSFMLFPVPILALSCFLLTINHRHRKIYHFMLFCLIVWLILWSF